MNIILLIGLPYFSILLLIAGFIYKYKTLNINSTSNIQHLESFREIPLFYTGLFILLFGHIIGFLIPSYVLAWNGEHMRLLIIETGAFGLGLATFFSIIVYIIRQIKSFAKPGQSTTPNLSVNILIYMFLLILIFSGLWTANFYRWGSSWYAGVITPYLRSFIKFSPDISAVQYMPVIVKVHIISAFVIIGIFPFTGLFDFLIYSISFLSVKKQTDYFKTIGLIGAALISASLSLYFGSSYEDKKADKKLFLMTIENKVIHFESKETKEPASQADSSSAGKTDSSAVKSIN